MVLAKITKLGLHLLKLCRKNYGLFFPDTVYKRPHITDRSIGCHIYHSLY